jgi:hypothetical protein
MALSLAHLLPLQSLLSLDSHLLESFLVPKIKGKEATEGEKRGDKERAIPGEAIGSLNASRIFHSFLFLPLVS